MCYDIIINSDNDFISVPFMTGDMWHIRSDTTKCHHQQSAADVRFSGNCWGKSILLVQRFLWILRYQVSGLNYLMICSDIFIPGNWYPPLQSEVRVAHMIQFCWGWVNSSESQMIWTEIYDTYWRRVSILMRVLYSHLESRLQRQPWVSSKSAGHVVISQNTHVTLQFWLPGVNFSEMWSRDTRDVLQNFRVWNR